MIGRISTPKRQKRLCSGFTLAETIVYVGIFILILVIVVTSIDSLVKSQRNLKSHIAIQESAISVFDRLVREARDAESVDVAASSFGSSPGIITLQSVDEADNPQTFKMYISGGRVIAQENGVDIGPLTRSGVTINSLVFYYIDGTGSDAIRAVLTMSAGAGSIMKTETFYTTAVLRSSY